MEISVVLPLYNKKDGIIKALESVFLQTYLPKEIIVVNDGSTDGSEHLVVSLNHPLVQLVHQENGGVSAARNKGIEVAKSEWVAFLDADDVWMPDYLETIRGLNKKYPESEVLATSYQLQSFDGTIQEITLNGISFTGEYGELSNYFEVASQSDPPIWSSAVVIKKVSLLEINGFPLNIKSGEDLITWARLALENQIAYTLKVGAVFIQDPAHTYANKPNRIPEKKDLVGEKLFQLYLDHSSIPYLKNYLSHWHKMRASIFLRLGNRKNAFLEICRALRFNQKNKKLYLYFILLLFPNQLVNIVFKKFS